MSEFLQRLKTWLARTADTLGRRLRQSFFLYLAVVFTVIAVVDAGTVNYFGGMRQSTFDLMLRLRVNVPKPDPDIVIVDIDEKSLAAMSADYGRWPWPRQVLAEFLEKVNAQQPKAVVFDVLFSDPDIQNPDSDAYFNDVLAKSPDVFLPMLRLDEQHDALSQLDASRIPGVVASPDAENGTKVAMVIPPFVGAQRAGHLGTHNVYPDSDGVVRSYPVWIDASGWEIPSLPNVVAQAEGKGKDAPDDLLLNWRGKPFTYHYVSFSDVYLDLLKEKPARPANEFRNKTIIIGSTAAGLLDVRGTPLDRSFPGVEILATAIDNMRHGDWLRAPEARLFYLGMGLLIIWGTAFAFWRSGASNKLDRVYGLSQFGLLAFSYATVNVGNVYINLTGPVFIGALYFSVARIYAFATARALDSSLVARSDARGGALRGLMLVLRFRLETREEAAIAKLAARLAKVGRHDSSVEYIQGRQSGLWRLFENTLVVCWAHPVDDESGWAAVADEAATMQRDLRQLISESGVAAALPVERLTVWRAEGRIRSEAPEDWQALLATALLEKGEEHS
ncbi:MAG TPA: CHASE2 domain-containing protein [Moraxellaceae bacterium]|nr:CHASE2 domain-containing protein [Moraxellaceae bacterium]